QCGTFQVDFSMPGRLGASYVGEDGARHVPVMLHRAILGSVERFIGILIEHYAGRFPLWLAPVPIAVASITQEAEDYAEDVARECKIAGLRVVVDSGNEKIGYKVREHSLAKVPVLLVVGRREAADRSVALRRLGGKDQEVLALGEAIARLKGEAAVPSFSFLFDPHAGGGDQPERRERKKPEPPLTFPLPPEVPRATPRTAFIR